MENAWVRQGAVEGRVIIPVVCDLAWLGLYIYGKCTRCGRYWPFTEKGNCRWRICLLFIFVASGSGEAMSSQWAWGQWFSTPLKQKPEFAFMADCGAPES